MFVASENGLERLLEIPLLGRWAMHFRPAIVNFLTCYALWESSSVLANLQLSYPTLNCPY